MSLLDSQPLQEIGLLIKRNDAIGPPSLICLRNNVIQKRSVPAAETCDFQVTIHRGHGGDSRKLSSRPEATAGPSLSASAPSAMALPPRTLALTGLVNPGQRSAAEPGPSPGKDL